MGQSSARNRVRWPDSARLDGARLRQLRLARNWTQGTLARGAGVAQGTVMRLGAARVPRAVATRQRGWRGRSVRNLRRWSLRRTVIPVMSHTALDGGGQEL